MVTMRDVARHAGVSQSTVSHLLNGTRNVNPGTRRAIEAAIDELGYVHDALARSLRTGRTHTVGMAISAISNPYFADFVRQVKHGLADTDRTLLLVDTRDEVERETRAVRQLLQHRPDGVLLAPAGAASEGLDLLLDRGVPTVLVDRVPPALPAHVDAVGVHNREPMRRLVAHLGGLGHRRIGLLAGVAGIATTTERVEGYRVGLAELDADAEPAVEHAGVRPSATVAAIDRLLSRTPRPTAVIGGNNQATIALMRWLTEHGLGVPGDVSLASFDDFEWSELFHPRLTAVRQPIESLAVATTSMLDSRIDRPERPGRIVRLMPELLVRDSTTPVG